MLLRKLQGQARVAQLQVSSASRWRVDFIDQGRDGYVVYEEGERRLSFYWAFGGGAVVASVAVGDEAAWRRDHSWAADRRDEIIARVTAEVIRQRTPTSRGEIDESGRFINFVAADDRSPVSSARRRGAGRPNLGQKREDAAAMFWRLNRLKGRLGALGLLLAMLGGGIILIGRSMLTIETMGTPIGASARAGGAIVTPIARLEPYVPSLARDHGRDRYSIGLLLHSTSNASTRVFIPAAEGVGGSAFGVIKIAAVDGDLVWFDAPETIIVDAKEGRRLSGAEARAAPVRPRPAGAAALAALATAEQRLEGLLVAPGDEDLSSFPNGDGEMFDVAFLRAAPHGPVLRVQDGDRLAIHWITRDRQGPLVVARVSAAGDVRWSTRTALGVLREVLPDVASPAFVGTRPREEGRVPEPLLVVVDVRTGRAQTHSLLVP